jgi:cold shock CspA family protein
MKTGIISRMGARGFGFIQPSDDGPAVYFHEKECFLRNTYLQVGDRVAFEINQFSPQGEPRACEVRVISIDKGKDRRRRAENVRIRA